MKIEIPLKALSVNEAFYGKHVKTVKCRDYENDVMKVLKNKSCIFGPVQVHYKFYLKNHKKADYDNCIKVTQDLLVKKHYIQDDSMIYLATIEKIPSEEDKTEIEILPLDNVLPVC